MSNSNELPMNKLIVGPIIASITTGGCFLILSVTFLLAWWVQEGAPSRAVTLAQWTCVIGLALVVLGGLSALAYHLGRR